MIAWWPPVGALGEALAELAGIVATRGAARWLDTPLAQGDYRDLPEPWRADRGVVERLLARLCWLAFVDLDLELEAPPDEDPAGVGLPDVRWTETVDGTARFELVSCGDRGAAGALAVEVGLAFLAWTAPGEDAPPPTPRAGAVAAIYLGLGVLVTAAIAADEEGVLPLSLDEALYLLAAQAITRGDDRTVSSTLPADVRARLADTIDGLAPHRDELVRHLAIDPALPRRPLEREPAPAFPRGSATVAFYGVHRIGWDAVGPASFAGREGALFAIWPEPCEEDPVLVRAGLDAGPKRRRGNADQSSPVADLGELIEGELRTPPGAAPWDAPSTGALSYDGGVVWLWLAAPHDGAWSRVLEALIGPPSGRDGEEVALAIRRAEGEDQFLPRPFEDGP